MQEGIKKKVTAPSICSTLTDRYAYILKFDELLQTMQIDIKQSIKHVGDSAIPANKKTGKDLKKEVHKP